MTTRPDSGSYDNGNVTGEDVQRRFEVGRFLGKEVWPADRETLLGKLAEQGAPDHVVAEVRRLPAQTSFVNMQDVARHLGIAVEDHRA